MVKPIIELIIEKALKHDIFFNELMTDLFELADQNKFDIEKSLAEKQAAIQAKIDEREERRKRSIAYAIEKQKALLAARIESKKILLEANQIAKEAQSKINREIAIYNKTKNHWYEQFKLNIPVMIKSGAEKYIKTDITLNNQHLADLDKYMQIYDDIKNDPKAYIKEQLNLIKDNWYNYVLPANNEQEDIINNLKKERHS
jgi:hypothetical protein